MNDDGPPDAGEIRTCFRETVRTARYHVAGADPGSARHICFVLHGYGQLAARILRHVVGIIPDGVCIVAPEALNRFYTAPLSSDGSHLQRVGATWLTREDREHEIADAMRWLDLVHDETAGIRRTQPPTTSVLGFSQGVATGMRWIMTGKVRPTHFIVWAGSLATDMDQQQFGRTMSGVATTVVAGTRDELLTAERVSVLRQQLDLAGLNHRFRTFDGGHQLDSALLRDLLGELTDVQVH